MRDIRFRAWFKNKMVGTFTIWQYDSDCSTIATGETLYNDETILMQYTGLHDKNGKEIFEGDIGRQNNWAKDARNLAIIWSGGGCWSYNDEMHSRPNWSRLEIIGNIYENPELLQSKELGESK